MAFRGVMNMPAGAKTLEAAVVANALRVYNAGAIGGLRTAGVYIATRYDHFIKDRYSREGNYRRYKHPDPQVGWTHSSTPGTPPAKQTGDLMNSVRHAVRRLPGRNPVNGQFVRGFGMVEIKVYTQNPYAVDLEYGTSKIAARPNWRTAATDKKMTGTIITNTKAHFVAAERAAARLQVTGVPVTLFGREAMRRG